MRLVFAGTPEFAAQALAALVGAGHEISLVLTQPDRKAGRGLHASAGPVKRLALEQALPIAQPEGLREEVILQRLHDARPDALVVAAYGLILPQTVLDLPELGALNIHASLLPRWRGAAPIQRAILAGDSETGITLMKMDAGLDTGPMLAREAMPILPEDTALTLHDKLAGLGARMIVSVLRDEHLKGLVPQAQPTEGVTYARKVEKKEAALDWRRPAAELERAVRAFNPVPGAHALHEGSDIKVWRARAIAGDGEPGCVQASGLEGALVSCGEGALLLTELQRPGGKRLAARAFLGGHPIKPGSRFSFPA